MFGRCGLLVALAAGICSPVFAQEVAVTCQWRISIYDENGLVDARNNGGTTINFDFDKKRVSVKTKSDKASEGSMIEVNSHIIRWKNDSIYGEPVVESYIFDRVSMSGSGSLVAGRTRFYDNFEKCRVSKPQF
jgi:hypothetical protein